MKPLIGKIVHYYTDDDAKAAIITRVVSLSEKDSSYADNWEHNHDVYLAVFHVNGLYFVTNPVPFSRNPENGCWSWPPQTCCEG
jgi:hypothetical protein